MSSLRLDRLLTLCIFRHLRSDVPGRGGFRLPVLMYHSVSDRSEAGVSPYYRTATSPKVFAEQMALLLAEGWEVVSLKAGLEALRGGRATPMKVVALTFDDGFRDFRSAAFPILRQHGFGATVYLPTAFIGQQPIQFKAHECLTWDEVRELHQAGIEFGSHTVNHPELVRLPWPEVEREVRDSKTEIEQRLGARVTAFAYPYAFPRAQRELVGRLRRLLCETGYESCVTTDIGRASAGTDLFAVPRLPMNDCDDAELLKAKLAGAYDWLAVPQRAFKTLKRLMSWKGGTNEGGN
ncbi:MAG: polysaccharide deacetylase family protein [Verrucomicrobia bacterium]|nr:polysaccharide deacetylase family protein [Verrucomicrobiota bacterium]